MLAALWLLVVSLGTVVVAAPQHAAFVKSVHVDGVAHPPPTDTSSALKVVSVSSHQPQTHTVIKTTHPDHPPFHETQTFAQLDNAGAALFQTLGGLAGDLRTFLSGILRSPPATVRKVVIQEPQPVHHSDIAFLKTKTVVG